MAAALGEVGADPSIGDCACLRRELSGEPDVVNLHLRFDEGRVGRALGRRPLSYSTGQQSGIARTKNHF
jgi:hypothetical protein